MEKDIFNKFNALEKLDDDAKSQDYEIATATKWLNAAQDYKNSGPYGLPENSTEQAFFDGTIECGGLEMIENNLRDLSTAVFRDQITPKPDLSSEDRLTQNDNMAYFETWMMMKEQTQQGDFDPKLTQDFLVAKKIFADACRHHGDSDRSVYRSLIEQASNFSESLLIQLRPDPESPASLPFAYTSLKIMKARIIHDMAAEGAYSEGQGAANFMAVESLWESAESIAEMDKNLMPEWTKNGYLDEIRYFKRLYSAESGLDENIKPSLAEKQKKLSDVSNKIGEMASKKKIIPPHAA